MKVEFIPLQTMSVCGQTLRHTISTINILIFKLLASEEGSLDDLAVKKCATVVQPLIFCVIAQPHMFFTCSSGEQRFETSVYDASIAISPKTHLITSSDGLHIPIEQDYKLHIFKTKPGDPNKLGIPPSLITITVKDFLTSQIGVVVKIERPFKLSYSEILRNEFDRIFNVLYEASGIDELNSLLKSPQTSKRKTPNNDDDKEESFNESIKQIRQVLGYISILEVHTKQMIAELVITSKEKQEMLFGMFESHSKFKMESVTKEATQNMLNQIDSEVSLRKIFIRTISQKKNYNLLAPLTVSLDSIWTWTNNEIDTPNINFQILVNPLTLYISPRNVEFVEEFVQFIRKFNKSKIKLNTEYEKEEQNCMNMAETTKSSRIAEQHYVDDLRAGILFHTLKLTNCTIPILPFPHHVYLRSL